MKDLAPISAQLMTVPGGVLLDRPGPGTNDDPVIYAKIASIVHATDEEIDDWDDVKHFLADVVKDMLHKRKWNTAIERLVRVVSEASTCAEELNEIARERGGFTDPPRRRTERWLYLELDQPE